MIATDPGEPGGPDGPGRPGELGGPGGYNEGEHIITGFPGLHF
ncbi:hypothetical protein [Aneurinibacillus migulanus]|nr:hypothetical protein [Aneurinibacillus migulanus]